MKPLTGTVVSTKMNKTVVVSIETKWQHPMYKKTLKRNKKYLVHDELGVKAGDLVTITATKPISRRKRWLVSSVQNTNTPSIKSKSKPSK